MVSNMEVLCEGYMRRCQESTRVFNVSYNCSLGIPSKSTWGSIYRGVKKVIITMAVMPPFNHYILTLHSLGSLWPFNIYKYFCALPIAARHMSPIFTASPIGAPGVNDLRRDLLMPWGPPPGPIPLGLQQYQGSPAKLVLSCETSEDMQVIVKLSKVLA
jgi:hypothetical protein